MKKSERYMPIIENLGKNCFFWKPEETRGCTYPNAKLEGRTSCEGIIDDVCIYLQTGRTPSSLTREQLLQIKTRPSSPQENTRIPPGDIKI